MDQSNNEDSVAGNKSCKWVSEVLRLPELATISDSETDNKFKKRCAEAAGFAFSVAKLRSEGKRVGFVPLPAIEYIKRLMEMVNIPEAPFLSWLSEENSSITTPKRVAAFGQLAQRIDMSLREALAHLRIGFSAQVGPSPVPVLLARARASDSFQSAIESCEDLLDEIESDYDVSTLRQLRALEAELSTSYGQGLQDLF